MMPISSWSTGDKALAALATFLILFGVILLFAG